MKKLDGLCNKYTTLFGKDFYFECMEGWYDLIDELCYNLSKMDGFENIIVNQVKEKFAGLRFYINYYSVEMEKEINVTEEKSYTICEMCGNKGTLRKSSWLKTLCDKCNKVFYKKEI